MQHESAKMTLDVLAARWATHAGRVRQCHGNDDEECEVSAHLGEWVWRAEWMRVLGCDELGW